MLVNVSQVFYQVLRSEQQVDQLRNSLHVQEARVADQQDRLKNGLATGYGSKIRTFNFASKSIGENDLTFASAGTLSRKAQQLHYLVPNKCNCPFQKRKEHHPC